MNSSSGSSWSSTKGRLEMSIVTDPTPGWGQQTIVAKAADQPDSSLRYVAVVVVAFQPHFTSIKAAGLAARLQQELITTGH